MYIIVVSEEVSRNGIVKYYICEHIINGMEIRNEKWNQNMSYVLEWVFFWASH